MRNTTSPSVIVNCAAMSLLAVGLIGCGLVRESQQSADSNLRALRERFGGRGLSQSPGYVSFWNEPMNDEQFRQAFPYLKAYGVDDLDLNGRAITDSTVPLLLQLHSLRRLQLQGTKVTFDGLVRLAALPQLKVIAVKKGDMSGDELCRLHERMPSVVIREEWITVRSYNSASGWDEFREYKTTYPKYARWVR